MVIGADNLTIEYSQWKGDFQKDEVTATKFRSATFTSLMSGLWNNTNMSCKCHFRHKMSLLFGSGVHLFSRM